MMMVITTRHTVCTYVWSLPKT